MWNVHTLHLTFHTRSWRTSTTIKTKDINRMLLKYNSTFQRSAISWWENILVWHSRSWSVHMICQYLSVGTVVMVTNNSQESEQRVHPVSCTVTLIFPHGGYLFMCLWEERVWVVREWVCGWEENEYVRDKVYVWVIRCSMDNIQWNPSILVTV